MKFFSGLILVVSLAAASAVSSSSRIIGGNNAPQGSASYHAHLVMGANAGAATHVGSGSLISPQHILTTASNVAE